MFLCLLDWFARVTLRGLAMYSAAVVKSFKYCGVAKTIPFGTAH